jgi:hypothetical protein
MFGVNSLGFVRCGIAPACLPAMLHHARRLARIRLTRTAAERGPVLSGACGQVAHFASSLRAGPDATRFRTGPHPPYEDGR